jgi:hypothetical protein
MEEEKVLAELGRVVIEFASMEWLVALLVCAVEGKGRERAVEISKSPGKAMENFLRVARSDAELLQLHEEVKALKARRNLLAHSVAMIGRDGRRNRIYLYWNPKSDEEAVLYPDDLQAATRDIRAVCARLNDRIQRESRSPAE